MNNLAYENAYFDIRVTELKLKRIRLNMDYLLDNKPSILEFNETKKWKNKLAKLKDEEELVYVALYQNYDKLASLLD